MRCPALLLVLALAPAPHATAAAAAADRAPALDRTSVPAAGEQRALLTIPAFGRYAITVTSAQGSGLQVVDRMAGPGPVAGAAGEKDGRLDLFLERGQYRVVTYGHRKASGTAKLAARAFGEKNAPQPPMIVELKPLEGTLEDHEQVSYWLEVKERRTLSLEAAGRSLADLRLWKEGQWLVDAAPATQVVQPVVGRPLLVCRLAAALEPGLYLVTAYGGPPQPWAEDDASHPFHFRFGIPRLGEAGRQRHAVSPFGVDRYQVPGAATFFRVELPEARPVSLQVGTFDPSDPFASDGSTLEIEKNTVPPVAETTVAGSTDKDHVVTVMGAAGQPYVLQHFEMRYEYTFDGSGDYWVSTVHSGAPADSVDATAVLTRSSPVPTQHSEPFLAQAVELDAKTPWARRANLLAPLTVFLNVKQAGRYQVLAQGTEARFRIEPFFIYRPERYQPPPFRSAGSTWDLDAGYFVLTAEPVKKGILDVAVRPASLVDFVLEKVGLGRTVEAKAVRAAVRFPQVALERDRSYTLYLNRQPEVQAGVILRPLPVDLTDPLPLAQQPGDAVSVPFRAAETSVLRADAEDGASLEVSLDGGAWQTSATVEAGTHTASVRHARAETVVYSLRLEPVRLQASTPLPPLRDGARAALPAFPVLTETAPQFLDLPRAATATFVVRADAPSLYRLQSSGLLATEGNLRTRTVTSFVRESQNGVGRNFLVQQYLREGDYQMTLTAQGQSTGHLGVSLSRTRLVEGGFLTNRLPARISLPAGDAVSYRFVITRSGEFRVRAAGLGRSFRCRLEDQDGWPLTPPNGAADIAREFGPGRYRLVILPEATDARVLTLIEPVPRPRRLKGHGPHALALAQQVGHVWLEPESGGERVPDAWDVSVPAPMDASIELTGEMQGTLFRIGDGGAKTQVAFVPPGRGFKGALAPGRYRLEAVASRRNNYAPYQVAVWPEPLVAGLDRDVTAPADIPVSVGQTGLYELASFGSADVRARLYDGSGRLVEAADDRPDDWNFSIARSLSAGAYRLRVDPVGARAARCTVSMRAPREAEKPPLALPAGLEVAVGRVAHVYPLTVPASAGLLLLAADSGESVGVALEVSTGEGWRALGSATGRRARLEIPLAKADEPARYRARVWMLDRRDAPVRLSAAAVTPALDSESRLASGTALTPVAGLQIPLAAAGVRLEHPGLFRADGRGALRWCAAPLEPCREAPNGLVAASGSSLWVVGEVGAGAAPTAKATRVVLPQGAAGAVQFRLPSQAPARCDLGSAGGPILVWASTRAGQPGVRVVEEGDGFAASGRTLAVGARAAVAVSLRPRRPAALVWSALPGEAPEVRLEQTSYALTERESAGHGPWDGSVAGARARAFELGSGRKRVHLALGDSLVAVLSKGDEVESVHWAGGEPFAESVEAEADRLTLLHTGDGEDRFSVDAIPLPADAKATPLSPGASYEGAHVRAGTVRLAVAPPGASDATLHVRGSREDAIFVGAGGGVARGADLPVDPKGGTLLVPHAPGLVLAWVDRPGQEAQDLWAQARAAEAVKVELPASVALSGATRAFRLEPAAPVMVHLRTAAPVVTLLRRGQDPPEVDVHARGGVLDAYLPAGRSELVVRAVASGTLSGIAEITATPVTPIGDGLGPEVLLAPGATRLFSFTVAHEGPLGIGVRASADVVESVLFTSAGRRLGTGVVQMPTLTPGTYLLALHAPQDAQPVRARPALAGLVAPGTGPPEDVVRRYLEPEEAPPAFTARRVVEPARRWAPEAEEPALGEPATEESVEAEPAEGENEETPPEPEDAVEEAPEGPGAGGGAC